MLSVTDILNHMSPTRLFFKDLKPYSVPARLEDLHGTASGTLVLPHAVWWAPSDPVFELSEPRDVVRAYSALVSEATPDQLAELVNRHLLAEHWSELFLPRELRARWELQFPSLSS